MSELLACPFCGETLVAPREWDLGGWFVYCSACGAEGPYKENVGEATELWNRRASAWLPIESAPKDGTWIFVCGGKTDDEEDPRSHALVQWSTYLNGKTLPEGRWMFAWYDGGYYGEYEAPKYWMPPAALPTPPSQEK